MKILLRLALLLLMGSFTAESQNAEEDWGHYLASYGDGVPGSTSVRMDLIHDLPLENLPYVVVTGLSYRTPRADGFPEDKTLEYLFKAGDELFELISKETTTLLVASYMYDGERLEYFYVEENKGLKEKIEDFYSEHYPKHDYYLNIKKDKTWTYYTEFLYPNEETRNYMSDESVVRNLEEAGDELSIERRVDHWLYFSTEFDMKSCSAKLEQMDFTIQSASKINDSALPYQLEVWKVSKVDINSIYPITSSLETIAKKHNGDYDGWETSVEKK